MLKISFNFFSFLIFILLFINRSLFAQNSDSINNQVRHFFTEDGVEFGLWGGNGGSSPVPILFILANSIDGTLGDEYFRNCGNYLAKDHGWLCVSLDLPFHGMFKEKKRPNPLDNWASAVKDGTDFVEFNNLRMRKVLDFLIKKGFTTADSVAVSGISRGGYLALQFAAFEPRVKSVVAFCPVVNLFSLSEFNGIEQDNIKPTFNLFSKVDLLSSKRIWITIGNKDNRVGTEQSINFFNALSNYTTYDNDKGSLELVIKSESKGHTIPKGTVEMAKNWLLCN